MNKTILFANSTVIVTYKVSNLFFTSLPEMRCSIQTGISMPWILTWTFTNNTIEIQILPVSKLLGSFSIFFPPSVPYSGDTAITAQFLFVDLKSGVAW